MSTSDSRPPFEQQTARTLAARAAFWGSNEGLMREIEQHAEWDGVLATAIRIVECLDAETWAGMVACGWVEDTEPALNALGEPMPKSANEALARQLLAELNELMAFGSQALTVGERYGGEGDDLDAAYARKKSQIEALGFVVTAGSETGWALALAEAPQSAPCPDCNPEPEIPAPLLPHLAAFVAAWDERALSLARVARALAPEPVARTLPAGCRVKVTFGPDAGQTGTVESGPSPDGYYSVRIDGRPADNWGGLWFFLPHEITLTTTPPAESRPWANDDAYAAEGQRVG